MLTFITDSPNSREATYASPVSPFTATSLGVPTPGTKPINSRGDVVGSVVVDVVLLEVVVVVLGGRVVVVVLVCGRVVVVVSRGKVVVVDAPGGVTVRLKVPCSPL